MKLQCLVYGNCQAMAMASLLSKHPEFSEKYDIIDIQPVHLIKADDIPALETYISSVSLFIYQHVSDKYRGLPGLSTRSLLSKINPDAQKISIPVAYFTGYHPEITYLKSSATEVVSKPFPYHDLNILKLYAHGKSAAAIVDELESEQFYDEAFVLKNFQKTLESLSEREQNLDIKLAPFIKNNFQKSKLFHTFNHPSSPTIEFILDSIVSRAGITTQQRSGEVIGNLDVLSRSSFPAYPSLAKILGLEFEHSSVYRIEREHYTKAEMVKHFCDFYDSNSQQIDLFLQYTASRT